ncbi:MULTISPECIES: hypothetical protein [Mycobacteriaceae]|uniref:Membrane protein n=1 Tax=Mycolicibacterium neoaurum VKM Ac-1815D TaxID=700508 RepID=V5X9T7_MYCNE|nr:MULTISPECIES: hypothetical protein [Mycobacteriaceae]AXK76365.1 hypothetical protein DXK33_15885 [Mycolicibacterium neoaurum]KUM10026.1 hypothetical protein AVZ31_04130 [Mycolicibacterium neoaurum]
MPDDNEPEVNDTEVDSTEVDSAGVDETDGEKTSGEKAARKAADTSAPADDSDDDDSDGDETGSTRGPAVIAVSAMLVAIATLGASAYMWRNPVNSGPAAAAAPVAETFTEEQRAQSQAQVCDAFALVSVGVANSSAMQQPAANQGNFGAAIAVAANARLALLGGGQFLLNRVEPATPDELADAARDFGNTLMDVGAAAIAEIPTNDPAQQQRLKDADEQNTKLDQICNPPTEPAPAPPAPPGAPALPGAPTPGEPGN